MNGSTKRVIVLGGGIAGLSSAKALADLGLEVTLVDRSRTLGGHAAGWACMATDECTKCSSCLVQEQMGEVLTHPLITVMLGGQLDSVRRDGGSFHLSFVPNPDGPLMPGLPATWFLEDRRDIEGRCVVLATGFEPFDPRANPLLGYGRFDGVFTTSDVDRVLRHDDLSAFLPEHIERPRVAFIQCVGSRDRTTGREYCSQFCCRTTIRQVRKLLHLKPGLDATVFYIDLQIMSKEFVAFYKLTRNKVQFALGVPAEITQDNEKRTLKVFGTASGSDRATSFEFDRVVLAIGLAPTSAHRPLAEKFGLRLNEQGYFASSDSLGHVETQTNGVFTAGACAGPTDIQGSRKQAMAVAARVARLMGVETKGTGRQTGRPRLAVAAEH